MGTRRRLGLVEWPRIRRGRLSRPRRNPGILAPAHRGIAPRRAHWDPARHRGRQALPIGPAGWARGCVSFVMPVPRKMAASSTWAIQSAVSTGPTIGARRTSCHHAFCVIHQHRVMTAHPGAAHASAYDMEAATDTARAEQRHPAVLHRRRSPLPVHRVGGQIEAVHARRRGGLRVARDPDRPGR